MSATYLCPLCAKEREPATAVTVCEGCFRRAEASRAPEMPPATTGEFAAVAPDIASALLEETANPPPRPAGEVRCTWCGKSGADVKKLLSNQTAHICNECVGFCAEILAAELGDDWRG